MILWKWIFVSCHVCISQSLFAAAAAGSSVAMVSGVLCLDVSVEADLLVAGSDDGGVVVWSLRDQQLIRTLLGHTGQCAVIKNEILFVIKITSCFTCCADAILSVKVIDSSSHCVSLAADGSLRRWNLKNGQQLLCIQEAVPADSTPSSVHLHLCEQKQLLCVYTRTQVQILWISFYILRQITNNYTSNY